MPHGRAGAQLRRRSRRLCPGLVARGRAILLGLDLRQRPLRLDRSRHRRRRLQLRDELGDLLPPAFDVRDQLGSRAGPHLALGLQEPLPLAGRCLALAGQLRAQRFRVRPRSSELLALGIEPLQRPRQRRAPATQQLAGTRADVGG